MNKFDNVDANIDFNIDFSGRQMQITDAVRGHGGHISNLGMLHRFHLCQL